MPVQLIVQLLVAFGPSAIQLVDQLIAKWESNGAVTAAEWTTLRQAATQTAKDRMLLQLQTAGIDPASPQGVALLAAAS